MVIFRKTLEMNTLGALRVTRALVPLLAKITGKFLRNPEGDSVVTRLRQGYGGQVPPFYACRNGFVTRSRPIVVGGPWPESTVTSSPSGNSFSLIPLIRRSISPPGKSPRPMLPEKRTSPPKSNWSLGEKKQRLPGQWPGTSRT